MKKKNTGGHRPTRPFPFHPTKSGGGGGTSRGHRTAKAEHHQKKCSGEREEEEEEGEDGEQREEGEEDGEEDGEEEEGNDACGLPPPGAFVEDTLPFDHHSAAATPSSISSGKIHCCCDELYNYCEQLRTTTNNYEQLRATTNNYEQLRTTTNNHLTTTTNKQTTLAMSMLPDLSSRLNRVGGKTRIQQETRRVAVAAGLHLNNGG